MRLPLPRSWQVSLRWVVQQGIPVLPKTDREDWMVGLGTSAGAPPLPASRMRRRRMRCARRLRSPRAHAHALLADAGLCL